ncbi:hypothetical protein AB0C33_01945 [Nonomuraea sp. NPDC048881]|uniref:hypothetical protein n=1 Tax=Nonomuraea sp. NPDC048881 TaxID=3155030 RepID=UPI0033C41473
MEHITAAFKRYHNARKGVHYLVTLVLFAAEAVAVVAVHDAMVHLTLSGSIAMWEVGVTALGE